MSLDWSSWDGWKKTWINLSLEARVIRWRDRMRWLNRVWINSTDLLIAWMIQLKDWEEPSLIDLEPYLDKIDDKRSWVSDSVNDILDK